MNTYKVFFRRILSKGSYVGNEVIKRATIINKLNNIFDDDDSENYEVIFNESQIDDIRLFKYCANARKSTEGFNIYGIDIRNIEALCDYEGNLHMKHDSTINKESQYICHFLGNQYGINLSDIEKGKVEKIKYKLKEKFNLENDEKLSEFLRHEYMIPMQNEWLKCSKLISEYYSCKKEEGFKELCIKNNIDIPENI